jgi:hypothetical protein
MPDPVSDTASVTLPFEKFWDWIKAHRNCILRAGTADAILFDHDDYHWEIFHEDGATHIVQLAKGKQLVGELVVIAGDIAFVQGSANEAQEHVFECVVELPTSREVAYHFVMVHGFEDEAPAGRRWTH